MLREFTCLVCPRGCALEADTEKMGDDRVKGATCAKGVAYAVQELDDCARELRLVCVLKAVRVQVIPRPAARRSELVHPGCEAAGWAFSLRYVRSKASVV